MQMQAKYNGKCAGCGGPIRAGDVIDYSRDTGARHPACTSVPVARLTFKTTFKATKPKAKSVKAKAPKAPSRPKAPYPDTPPCEGAVQIYGRRNGRYDSRWEVGQVVSYEKGTRYGVVLASQMIPPCEDNQMFGWHEAAWVRPATEAEATPVKTARSQKEAKILALRLMEHHLKAEGQALGDDAARRAHHDAQRAAVWQWTSSMTTAVANWQTVSVLEDGSVVSHHPGFYDDYRATGIGERAPYRRSADQTVRAFGRRQESFRLG